MKANREKSKSQESSSGQFILDRFWSSKWTRLRLGLARAQLRLVCIPYISINYHTASLLQNLSKILCSPSSTRPLLVHKWQERRRLSRPPNKLALRKRAGRRTGKNRFNGPTFFSPKTPFPSSPAAIKEVSLSL